MLQVRPFTFIYTTSTNFYATRPDASQAEAIKNGLEKYPPIRRAVVSIDPPQAIIMVEENLPITDLQWVVSKVGLFHLMETELVSHSTEPVAMASHTNNHAPNSGAGPANDHPTNPESDQQVPDEVSEPPPEQQALQHIGRTRPGHDGQSGPDNTDQHPGRPGMDHSKMNYDAMGHSKMGHDGHDYGAIIADFLRWFWVCIVLSVPVVALSTMFKNLVGYQLDFAFRNELVIGLDTHHLCLWELATLIDIMLLGHYIEMKSVAGASRSLELIVQMLPSDAHQIIGEIITDVPVDSLNKGDTVLVRPGERIPTDGEVVEGSSAVNESMLTGESVAAQKTVHDNVIAGADNGEGSLKIRVTHRGENSYLNKVVKLVGEAQGAKSRTHNLADRLAHPAVAVGRVHYLDCLAGGGSGNVLRHRADGDGDGDDLPARAGVAIPLMVAISTGISARNRLLIRNRTAFEESRKITAMGLDKTGTLTEGAFGVTRMGVLSDGFDENKFLGTVAALEHQSQHPIAEGQKT